EIRAQLRFAQGGAAQAVAQGGLTLFIGADDLGQGDHLIVGGQRLVQLADGLAQRLRGGGGGAAGGLGGGFRLGDVGFVAGDGGDGAQPVFRHQRLRQPRAGRRKPAGSKNRQRDGGKKGRRAAHGTSRLRPVISGGWSSPISASTVGATSASRPPLRTEAPSGPPQTITGTGLVV